MRRFVAVCSVFVLVLAACGSGEADEELPEETVVNVGDGPDDTPTNDATGGSGNGDGDGNDDDGTTGPDTEDFGDITGNPDLDAEDLPGQAGDLADAVDDIVSIGPCEAMGLMATAPEGMQCRVLDVSIGGMDGFTMFNEGNDLNISIGTPSPLGAPCEILQACDEAEPIFLSDNFPDTMIYEFAGTVSIWGNHASGAELVITKVSGPLTNDEINLIIEALDSVMEAG